MKLYGLSLRSCTTILLASVVICQLTACQPSSVRPQPPIPPQVSCNERAPAQLVPPIPATLDEVQPWMAQMIGIYKDANIKRATTADCLDALRKAGAIR